MKVLIIPNSFKGSISAKAVSQNIARGIKKIRPNFQITEMPFADGGTGTLEIINDILKGRIISTRATNPLGKKIKTEYGIVYEEKLAIIELARISGLHLLKEDLLNPLKTTTQGVGELIKNSIKKGCKRIIIGVGDSATIDCGIGAMSALGIKFLDKYQRPVSLNCSGLLDLYSINNSAKEHFKNIQFIVLTDVSNPLTGSKGAIVYAPQKGATKKDIFIIDRALKNFRRVILRQYKIDLDKIKGAGAAGGIAGGMYAIMNAKIVSGFQFLSRLTNLKSAIADADLVVTGEGRIDKTTFCGKATGKIIALCKEYRKKIILICGSYSQDLDYKKYGIRKIYSLIEKTDNIKVAKIYASRLLTEIGSAMAQEI